MPNLIKNMSYIVFTHVSQPRWLCQYRFPQKHLMVRRDLNGNCSQNCSHLRLSHKHKLNHVAAIQKVPYPFYIFFQISENLEIEQVFFSLMANPDWVDVNRVFPNFADPKGRKKRPNRLVARSITLPHMIASHKNRGSSTQIAAHRSNIVQNN